ncbi:MAG TPA: DNA repair exonuclease [Acidimicrobiales bacterium]
MTVDGGTSDARRPARLLHTSDVHLAVPGGREERAFLAALERAEALEVDAVLIAGDLFDHARVADEVLELAADALGQYGRPVVLMPGNHDVLDARSVHGRFDVEVRCPNVQFLDDPDGSVVQIPGTDVIVWGRGMVEHEPGFRPLAGIPERRADAWCIAAAHGLLVEDERSGRSSTILPADLDLDWDYIALGHVHEHRIVHGTRTVACYPGATAASKGGVPGVVVVDLRPGRPVELEWTALPA